MKASTLFLRSLPRRAALLAVATLAAAALLPACGEDLPSARTKLEKGDSPVVRAAAATRLGEIGGEEAKRLLSLRGLRDPAAPVRIAALRALARFDDPRLVDLLSDRLYDADPDVRRAAAEALAAVGGTKAKRYLLVAYARLAGPARPAVAKALTALGVDPKVAVEEGAQRLMKQQLEALKSPNLAERIGAAEALGRSGREEALGALLPLLAEPSVPLAAAAARALGRLGDDRAVGPLLKLLEEPYPELQAAAAWALGRLGGEEVTDSLAAA
ncbi:MAG: PBS lyase, partial [Deltaproteobacteria bacterium]